MSSITSSLRTLGNDVSVFFSNILATPARDIAAISSTAGFRNAGIAVGCLLGVSLLTFLFRDTTARPPLTPRINREDRLNEMLNIARQNDLPMFRHFMNQNREFHNRERILFQRAIDRLRAPPIPAGQPVEEPVNPTPQTED